MVLVLYRTRYTKLPQNSAKNRYNPTISIASHLELVSCIGCPTAGWSVKLNSYALLQTSQAFCKL